MKKATMISITFIVLGCLLPIGSLASTTYGKAHRKAVAACKGKDAGDPVVFMNRKNRRVKGFCVWEKGELLAISEKKLSRQKDKRSKQRD